jgi:hypothetical protein
LAQAQSPEPGQPKAPSLESTAQLIGVLSAITGLQKLSAMTPAVTASADRWQILWLHQHISEQVMATSLQVDANIAQIDNEISRADEVHSYLADRRDRTVNRANLLSVIIGGGLGATSSGLQLSSTLDKPAAGVGIGAGTLSASLAFSAFTGRRAGAASLTFSPTCSRSFSIAPLCRIATIQSRSGTS